MSPARRGTGKQRAMRIPLDYFKRADRIERWKLALVALAVLATAGYLAAGALPGRNDRLRYSHGPLAEVHATWDAQCQACHTPFNPVNGDAWATTAWRGSMDATTQKCQSCHYAPDHSAKQKPNEVRACTECHQDHQGRDANLSQVADRMCVECHGNLPAHVEGRPTVLGNVHRFDLDSHPPFRSTERDPGRLKFSHRIHMAPGLALPGERAGLLTGLDRVAPEMRGKYKTVKDKATGLQVVQLECASCHEPNSGGALASSGQTNGPSGAVAPSGAYMLPISYKNHCSACHQLPIEPAIAAEMQGEKTFDADHFLPHGLQPSQINSYLYRYFAGRVLGEHPELLKESVITRPLPGKPAAARTSPAGDMIARQEKQAAQRLHDTCLLCHQLSGLPTEADVAKVRVPSAWFQHARFDHASHRALSCLECHAKAVASEAQLADTKRLIGQTREQEDVLIPGLDTCVRCHAPRSESVLTGGARYGCVECHRYHGAQYAGHVPGSTSLAPKSKQPISTFLKGGTGAATTSNE